MPTYEYECKTCGRVMDVFQSITAAPLRKAMCEQCKAERPVKRLIGTGGGLIFKGSGFYQTDYRSEGYKNAAKADTSGDSTAATDSKKAETTKAGDKKDAAPPSAVSDIPSASTPAPAAGNKSTKPSKSSKRPK